MIEGHRSFIPNNYLQLTIDNVLLKNAIKPNSFKADCMLLVQHNSPPIVAKYSDVSIYIHICNMYINC